MAVRTRVVAAIALLSPVAYGGAGPGSDTAPAAGGRRAATPPPGGAPPWRTEAPLLTVTGAATADGTGGAPPVAEGGPTRVVHRERTRAGGNADRWIRSPRAVDTR